MEENDYPRIGKELQSWSELDSRLPVLNLDTELFLRRNAWIASLVILSAILKTDLKRRRILFDLLSPRYFEPRSLPRYLYEKFVEKLSNVESIPLQELEGLIPEYSSEVWNENPPEERMFFAHNARLRQILNLNPTEEQLNRAIELRKDKMIRKGY